MWKPGRQGSGYFKFKVFSFWRIDCYILKYPPGSYIKPHLDTVKAGKHYRVNITLKEAVGGMFYTHGDCIYYSERLIIFRPDIQRHGVSRVISGTRYVLSIGFLKNE